MRGAFFVFVRFGDKLGNSKSTIYTNCANLMPMFGCIKKVKPYIH